MLNGRVYGARRIDAQNTNMFVTAKDEEPEFVEWGYGGMGSVKAGKQNGGGGQWSRLQSDKAMGSGGAGAGVDDNLDDGGGMEWVRKRKEKRDREAKEREEKAKGGGVVEASSPVDTVHNQPSDPPLVEEQPSSKDISSPSPESSPTQDEPSQEPIHVTTTVTVPAPPPRPHHRTSSYSSSINTLHSLVNPNVNVTSSPGLEGDNNKGEVMVSSPLGGPFVLGGGGAAIESVEVSVGGIDDDDEDDDEDDEKVDDGDASASESESESDSEVDDEDEDDAQQIRRTALSRGAGVEKISRHKEDS